VSSELLIGDKKKGGALGALAIQSLDIYLVFSFASTAQEDRGRGGERRGGVKKGCSKRQPGPSKRGIAPTKSRVFVDPHISFSLDAPQLQKEGKGRKKKEGKKPKNDSTRISELAKQVR